MPALNLQPMTWLPRRRTSRTSITTAKTCHKTSLGEQKSFWGIDNEHTTIFVDHNPHSKQGPQSTRNRAHRPGTHSNQRCKTTENEGLAKMLYI